MLQAIFVAKSANGIYGFEPRRLRSWKMRRTLFSQQIRDNFLATKKVADAGKNYSIPRCETDC